MNLSKKMTEKSEMAKIGESAKHIKREIMKKIRTEERKNAGRKAKKEEKKR